MVIDDFISEYRQGRTPNPCVRCNQFIKFDLLLSKARELGCDYVATGHYARVYNLKPQNSNSKNMYHLIKGQDQKKDQSYFLYRINQEQLAHTLFPLGEMTKEAVRQLAKQYKLPVAAKPESQEICFVENDDYSDFIKTNAPELVRPGKIVDTSGQVVGEHQGIAFYTIGQRKGLGAHLGGARYVVKIDVKRNEVVIGSDSETLKNELIADDLSFVCGHPPEKPLKIQAKIRYNTSAVEALLEVYSPAEGLQAQVKFARPQRAVTPGQSVVFYNDEEVLGGGIISRED
ncbi:tRNA 2-thiouridine(34) synthase MnmA [candidate division WOR-1 bacterium RIFOXYB2_FULL_48_7]|uniref:tRNA-uridine 2-sulfurtransferase n=1 Tax=candidate division WOR-1 bacterium RIFOXYB2_FULL_48_7 TaxID=1802583 RepID=A0A1F4TDG1_UNCSA|nr:MAG: tRNA 2-thiouridine(34) synthase MnmA [candidate division WOR-1 bacterium RIFOXYB2_FULL_48_7]